MFQSDAREMKRWKQKNRTGQPLFHLSAEYSISMVQEWNKKNFSDHFQNLLNNQS